MFQKMGKIIAKHDLDLIHVHEPAIPAAGAAATMAAKIPVVGTFHAGGSACNSYGRFRPLAERIIASITVRIAVSEAARKCVAGTFPGDYRVIPNGIDVDTYAAVRQKDKIPGRILFIGRPEPRKGLAFLLQAFSALRRSMPEASLVVTGARPDEVKALARTLDGGGEYLDEVQALGRVPVEVKLEEMRKAEVFCAPSLGNESFGIILTEALAAGIPVVASDIAGYREVLAEGAAGVLVPPGDPAALEQALLRVLRDSVLRNELSIAGIAHSERYSWKRVVEQVIDAYYDALVAGPIVVNNRPVPLFGQIRHSLRVRKDAPTLDAGKRVFL
jgi:phosphatidylinositol alpha-mannosyltransferase